MQIMSDFNKWLTNKKIGLLSIIVTIILAIIGWFFVGNKILNFSGNKVSEQNSYGSGDNVAGNKVENNTYIGNQERQVDNTLLDEIVKCSKKINKNYEVVAVVNSNGLTSSVSDETSNFSGQIVNGLKSKGFKLEQWDAIYEAGAVIPDGVMVFGDVATNTVYVGRNSSSGKQVHCLDKELRLGYAGFGIKNFKLGVKNVEVKAEIVAMIIEGNSTTNKDYFWGIERLNGIWRPVIKIAS
ncbi:MAG: hypothetical protein G01um101413_347 [Parcubacteria group bacterium Gr01-1014_13]|nr:MAG: hypothetical protein G01um101413_347 [Parcubacteria group bacterium Gr01-1014_13]